MKRCGGSSGVGSGVEFEDAGHIGKGNTVVSDLAISMNQL